MNNIFICCHLFTSLIIWFDNSMFILISASEVYKKVCEVFGVKRLAKKSVISDDKYRSSQVTLLIGEDGWVKHVDNGIM